MNFIKSYPFKGIRYQNQRISFGMRRATVHKHFGTPHIPPQEPFTSLEHYGGVTLAYQGDRLWYASFPATMGIQIGHVKLEPNTGVMESLLNFKLFTSLVHNYQLLHVAFVPEYGLSINYKDTNHMIYAVYDRQAYDDIVAPADKNCAKSLQEWKNKNPSSCKGMRGKKLFIFLIRYNRTIVLQHHF